MSTRSFAHVASVSPSKAVEGESPVTVYSSSNFEEFNGMQGDSFHSKVLSSSLKTKFMSLVPFYIEARQSKKHYIIKMDFFPKAEIFRFTMLKLGGIHEEFVPADLVIPVNQYDYWCAHKVLWSKQHPMLDLDMIYGNYVNKEMYVFDKDGTWHDEGVDHEGLSLEKRYNEHNWYDEFNGYGL